MKSANHMLFSKAETSTIMLPSESNALGNVHGGEILKIMDNTAVIAAMKHACGDAVTARIDEVIFHSPIHIGSIVTCTAQVAYAGRTSMQVFVIVAVHDLKEFSEPNIALTAFFTMVHLDQKGEPSKVPKLIPDTEEEKKVYLEGEKKYFEIRCRKSKRL